MSLSGINRWKQIARISWIQPREEVHQRDQPWLFFIICWYFHEFKILEERMNSPGTDRPSPGCWPLFYPFPAHTWAWALQQTAGASPMAQQLIPEDSAHLGHSANNTSLFSGRQSNLSIRISYASCASPGQGNTTLTTSKEIVEWINYKSIQGTYLGYYFPHWCRVG